MVLFKMQSRTEISAVNGAGIRMHFAAAASFQ
jgi:hypothetical protein